jgi:acyl dehydratase
MTDPRMGEALWQALERMPRGSGVIFRHYGMPGRRAMLMAERADFIEPIFVGARVSVSARVQQVSPAARAATLSILVTHGGVVAARASATTRIRGEVA